MNDYKVTDTELSSVANAIRTKGGTSALLQWPDGFVSAISDISSGGIVPSGSLSISANGTYDVASFANAVVDVPTGGGDDVKGIIERSLSIINNSNAVNIAPYTFAYYYGLTSVEMANVTSIGDSAFLQCSSLTAASFPACTSIGSYAFRNCSSLTTISFPACTTIGESAFLQCSSLTTISFPSCTTIGTNAFANCRSLAEVSFPACTSIGSYTFLYCIELQMASFPSCTTIGTNAFANCSKLESIYFLADSVATLLNVNAFTSTPMSSSSYLGYFGSIFVPESLVGTYKSATNWSVYSERIVAYTGV